MVAWRHVSPMSDDPPERLDGLSLNDAVEAVVAREPDRERGRVRETLATLTDDEDVVRASAVEGALDELSEVVDTAETRTELAGSELLECRMNARRYDDLDAVVSRFDALEGRMTSAESRVEGLLSELDALADGAGPDHETAAEIRRIAVAANEVQRDADELMDDVSGLERWLSEPDVRHDELDADVGGLERSLSGLAEQVEQLDAGVENYGDDAGHAVDGYHGDAGTVWVDLAFRHRAIEPLLADLRAELADLRELDERADEDDEPAGGGWDEFADRLDDAEARHGRLGDRIDALAREAWVERYGEPLSSLEATLADVEPPVDWDGVQAALDDHREAVGVPR